MWLCVHCRGANKVILNWQRPLWEGDQEVVEVVKSSGRDEPMWVAIHKHMEAMLGISLYLYLKLAKPLCFSFISYVSLQQDQKTRGWNRFCQVEGGGR
jgi:hypothetical protein